MNETKTRRFYNQAEIAKARTVPLIEYLQRHEPQQILSVEENALELRDYGRLKLTGGRWYCAQQNVKGANALDYLVVLRRWSFPEAVAEILKDLAEKAEAPVTPTTDLPEEAQETFEDPAEVEEEAEEDEPVEEAVTSRALPFFQHHFIP